jgi:hypothetical protein
VSDAVLPHAAGTLPPWTVTPDGSSPTTPQPPNGDCGISAAYDAQGLTVVTWGTTVKKRTEASKEER